MDDQQNQDAADRGVVGTGPLRYRVATEWLQLPPQIELVEVTAVAVDVQDRVLIFNRDTECVRGKKIRMTPTKRVTTS